MKLLPRALQLNQQETEKSIFSRRFRGQKRGGGWIFGYRWVELSRVQPELSRVSDEFQGSPPSRAYNTAKLELHRQFFIESRLKICKIGGDLNIFTTKGLKSKLDTAKYSIFGGAYRQSDNLVDISSCLSIMNS